VHLLYQWLFLVANGFKPNSFQPFKTFKWFKTFKFDYHFYAVLG